MEIREQLTAGNYYHISTKGNGTDLLFQEDVDYTYFLRKMHLRLTEAWSIVAYTLLPSEIHLVVKIEKQKIDGEHIDHAMLLSHLLNGYAQHYNYKYLRTGSLMHRSFRRERIQSEEELRDLICKVHNLPVATRLVDSQEKWKFSSYNESSTRHQWCELALQEIEKLFGGWKNFFDRHFQDVLFCAELNPRKYWLKILCSLETEFRKLNPLGVHRWCRRVHIPP